MKAQVTISSTLYLRQFATVSLHSHISAASLHSINEHNSLLVDHTVSNCGCFENVKGITK